MIPGIVCTLLFLLTCVKYLTRRFKLQKTNKFFSKIHVPVACILLAVSVLHAILVLPMADERPYYVFLTGWLCMVSFIVVALSGVFRKKLGKSWLKIHRIIAVIACIMVVLHIAANLESLVSYKNKVAAIEIEEIDVSQIPDGVYIGECDVTFLYAKVAVTVQAGEITDVEILEHRSTEHGIPAERVAQDIVDEQRIDVDIVAGATNSSTVIKKAVYNALYYRETA